MEQTITLVYSFIDERLQESLVNFEYHGIQHFYPKTVGKPSLLNENHWYSFVLLVWQLRYKTTRRYIYIILWYLNATV